jgi:hypothetical protein
VSVGSNRSTTGSSPNPKTKRRVGSGSIIFEWNGNLTPDRNCPDRETESVTKEDWQDTTLHGSFQDSFSPGVRACRGAILRIVSCQRGSTCPRLPLSSSYDGRESEAGGKGLFRGISPHVKRVDEKTSDCNGHDSIPNETPPRPARKPIGSSANRALCVITAMMTEKRTALGVGRRERLRGEAVTDGQNFTGWAGWRVE